MISAKYTAIYTAIQSQWSASGATTSLDKMTDDELNKLLDGCDGLDNILVDGGPLYYLTVQKRLSRPLGSLEELSALHAYQSKLDEQARAQNIGEVLSHEVADDVVNVNMFLYDIDGNKDESAPAMNAFKVLQKYLCQIQPCHDGLWKLDIKRVQYPNGVVTVNAVISAVVHGGHANA